MRRRVFDLCQLSGRANALAALVLATACSEDAGRAAGSGGGSSVSGLVRCTLYYRASTEAAEGQLPEAAPEFEERILEVAAGTEDSVTLSGLTLNVHYADDAFEGGSVSVRVQAGETSLFSTLYQLHERRLPANQFAGGHGFTGLMYLTHPTDGGDYQLICQSVS